MQQSTDPIEAILPFEESDSLEGVVHYPNVVVEQYEDPITAEEPITYESDPVEEPGSVEEPYTYEEEEEPISWNEAEKSTGFKTPGLLDRLLDGSFWSVWGH